MISEVLGLQISRRIKGELNGLDQSGLLMTKWFRGFIKSQSSLFFNHSGLNTGSFSTASDFRKFLIKKEVKKGLTPFLKTIPIYTKKGRTNALGNITVKGKSGTMHYIRGLSGYICVDNEPRIGFAIFSADLTARKDNLSNKFEKPKGASAWLSRAVIQERRIVRELCRYLKSD
jgi:D-alanyl-D-alanine carboxypeptidase/D-alanyl-D-alanine-endopeptidase (penicillin-binding protein 4)